MRYSIAFLLAGAMMSTGTNAQTRVTLSSLQWDYRVIAAFTGDAAQTASLLETLQNTPGITDRDVAWFVVGPDAITSNLDTAKVPTRDSLDTLRSDDTNAPQAVLVGKDGGIKARQNGAPDLDALFNQIDSMPMRQREMRESR